jgi:hypothetical protein
MTCSVTKPPSCNVSVVISSWFYLIFMVDFHGFPFLPSWSKLQMLVPERFWKWRQVLAGSLHPSRRKSLKNPGAFKEHTAARLSREPSSSSTCEIEHGAMGQWWMLNIVKPHKNIPKMWNRVLQPDHSVVHLTAVDCFGRHCSTDIEHPRGKEPLWHTFDVLDM